MLKQITVRWPVDGWISQRACRDRKQQYISDLERKIKDAEGSVGELRGENSRLIQELCKLREANTNIRDALNIGVRSSAAKIDISQTAENGADFSGYDDSPPCSSSSLNHEAGFREATSEKISDEADSLQDLLSAMLELILLHPRVVQGNISAKEIMVRLVAGIDSGRWR